MLILFVLAGLMDGAGPLAGQVVATVAMAFLGLALLALVWGTWATYHLWRWENE